MAIFNQEYIAEFFFRKRGGTGPGHNHDVAEKDNSGMKRYAIITKEEHDEATALLKEEFAASKFFTKYSDLFKLSITEDKYDEYLKSKYDNVCIGEFNSNDPVLKDGSEQEKKRKDIGLPIEFARANSKIDKEGEDVAKKVTETLNKKYDYLKMILDATDRDHVMFVLETKHPKIR